MKKLGKIINICWFSGGIYISKSKVYGWFLFDFTRPKMVELWEKGAFKMEREMNGKGKAQRGKLLKNIILLIVKI